jgi:hypothetical protein
MPILIKVAPQELSPAPITIQVPKAAANVAVVGDRAFVWFAETQGGRGLVAVGAVEAVQTATEGSVTIILGELTTGSGWVGNTDIKEFRNSDDSRAESTLAKKIYRFAHNRVVRLTTSEAEFLTNRVEGV